MSRATGTYKGRILEHVFTVNRKGYPTEILRLMAAEVYDEAEKEWVGIEDHDGEAEVAYLVLCTTTQEIFHLANLRKALDWTDPSVESLAKGDWVGTVVQYRVEENDYEGKITQQVKWVREADASVGAFQPASDQEIKEAQQKFGGFFKNSATGTTKTPPPVPHAPKPAASAKKTTKKGTKTTPPTEAPEPTSPVDDKPADADPPPVAKSSFFEREATTEEETWNLICEAAEVSEESEKNVEQYWFDAKKMHGDDWSGVKQYVLEQMIPF